MTELGGASRLIAKELEEIEKHGSSKARGRPPIGGARKKERIGSKPRQQIKKESIHRLGLKREEIEVPIQPIGGIGLDTEGPDQIPLGPGAEKPTHLIGTSWEEGSKTDVPDTPRRPMGMPNVPAMTEEQRMEFRERQREVGEKWRQDVEEWREKYGVPSGATVSGGKIYYLGQVQEQINPNPGQTLISVPVKEPLPPVEWIPRPVKEPPPPWQDDPQYRKVGTPYTVIPGKGYAPREWWEKQQAYEKWLEEQQRPSEPKFMSGPYFFPY